MFNPYIQANLSHFKIVNIPQCDILGAHHRDILRNGDNAFGSSAAAFRAIVLWFLLSMILLMSPKRAYADEFRLKVANDNEQSRQVDSVVCRFCQTFGCEVDAVVRKRAKMKAFQFFKEMLSSTVT